MVLVIIINKSTANNQEKLSVSHLEGLLPAANLLGATGGRGLGAS
jgi:hypothetical protein